MALVVWNCFVKKIHKFMPFVVSVRKPTSEEEEDLPILRRNSSGLENENLVPIELDPAKTVEEDTNVLCEPEKIQQEVESCASLIPDEPDEDVDNEETDDEVERNAGNEDGHQCGCDKSVTTEDLLSDQDPPRRPSELASITECALGKVFEPFESVKVQLIRQARDILLCRYHGDYHLFSKEFLTPASRLLSQLKAECRKKRIENASQSVPCSHECCERQWAGWPLCHNRRLLVHLAELDAALLRPGDCYLYVHVHQGRAHLRVRRQMQTCARDQAMDTACPDEELSAVLQHLLVSMERGIERLEWDSLVKPWSCAHVFSQSEQRPCVDKRDCSVQTSPVEETPVEPVASFSAVVSNNNEPLLCAAERLMAVLDSPQDEEHDDGYYDNTIAQPTKISQVDQDLLHSRAVVLPGCRDVNGRSVAVFFMDVLRTHDKLSPTHLAELLMYLCTVPKKDVGARGLIALVSAQEFAQETWMFLDEAFSLVEANSSSALHSVVVWMPEGEKEAEAVFSTSRLRVEVVSSEQQLLKNIRREDLLPEFGGTYAYDHQEWMSFRKFLEPFVNGCRLTGRHLVGVMQELRGSRLPATASLTSQLIEQQIRQINNTFQDEQLRHLEEKGDTILKELQAYWTRAQHNSDYRDALDRSAALYGELRRAMAKLRKLADRRLFKLEGCLYVKTLAEESSQVLSWLCRKGEETLNRHQILADNINGIKQQEEEFEKFYFLAMRQIEKGNDLIEEAAMIGPSGMEASGSATANNTACRPENMHDLTTSLKRHLNSFSDRLEDTREKLEDTAKCYHLLDKVYEWALDTMGFVSCMKMDNISSPDDLIRLIKLLDDYLLDHPTISEDVFREMEEISKRLDNEGMLEQCKTAENRCRETVELIHVRQTTLLKVRQQKEFQSSRNVQWDEEIPVPRTTRSNSQPNNLWIPQTCSTPFSYVRRKSLVALGSPGFATPFGSYTAFPSNCYPVSSSSDVSQMDRYIEEKEAQFLSQGQITDDLTTQGPVASISRGQLESRNCSADASTPRGRLPSISKLVFPSSQKPAKKHIRNCPTWQVCDEALQKATAEVKEQNEKLCLDRIGSTESVGSLLDNEDSGFSDNSVRLHLSHSKSDPVQGPPVNSHLLTRVSSLDLPESTAASETCTGTTVTDEPTRSKKTLMLVMRELIQTERDYVKSLHYIIENYVPELLREDIPQALRGHRNVIFGNIEKICEFHSQYFLHELENCENSPFLVGQCFLQFERQFYLYALYNKNKPKSDSLMSEYGTPFFRKKQLELKDKMDLASYLLKPVQRMGKYALLLKQLLKECPEREKEAEHNDLKAAEDMVRFQLRHGNDLLAMDALRDCDVNVKEQGRLLRQDEFIVWQGRYRKSLRRVFLFEDLILYSKARRDPDNKGQEIYQYKQSIKTTDIGLTEQIGDSPTKFEIWFRKRKLHDIFILQAPSTDVRTAWIHEISKLLWKQALRNREMRLQEMSSMGVGNKPCLDIKPSEDQISDRAINFQHLSRGPRYRNSIAVSSFDQLRNNKRPHSIISVSSSSSSGSSGASYTFYGALNLGFEPGDSPRPHRSLTQQSQCSTESGFCTDTSLTGDSPTDGDHSRHKKAERSDSILSNESVTTNVPSSEYLEPPVEDTRLDENVTTAM